MDKKTVGIAEKLSIIKSMELYNDEEGYSETGGNSYRRGRSSVTGRFVSRDVMPYHDGESYGEFYDVGRLNGYHDANGGNSANAFDNGNSNHSYGGNMARNYSGHSQKDMQIYHIEQMMNSATSDDQRQFLQNWLMKLRNS